MKKTFTRGFTLIELLVVIAIIGILSSVVLASLNSARTKSRDAKRVSDIKNIQLAMELYFDSCGQYPATLDVLENNGCAGSQTLGDYLSAVPVDPSSGADYFYTGLNANCTSYHIGSQLEDENHQVLSSDSDADEDDTAANACTGDTSNADFAGGTTGAEANGDAAAAPIYDVTP